MVEEQDREVLRESELARKICMGEGKQFKNERCPHFDVLTWECVLLRDNPIRAVYEKRCLLKREFYAKAHIFLTKYPMDFRGEDVDLDEFIFGRHEDKKDRKGILEYELVVPAIHYMYSLINLSLKREIERILKDKDLIPKNRQCGNCVHRNPTEPHICRLEHIPGNKAFKPFYNQYFEIERKADDKACAGHVVFALYLKRFNESAPVEDGLLGERSLRLGAVGWKAQLEQFEAAVDVPVMFKAIQRCATNARTRKAEEKFQRWYEDNAFIYKRLVEGETYEQAKSQYVEERFGKNEKKRDAYTTKMRRDTENLGKCLSGKERCRELSGSEGEGL
jgi:hypothetical protein